jgi:glycosyltransferase involved in cell wall biosynthesis
MKFALIATVYNEGRSIDRWVAALRRQSVRPDEFVIVDAASTDDTVRRLREGFEGSDFPSVRLIVQPCNIAAGRNIAIRNTTADIVAVTDAGSIPDEHWLEEIVRPFSSRAEIGVVGGWCPVTTDTAFQQRIERYMLGEPLAEGSDCSPSSRNVAFTRASWQAVGGYPEWLTLTAEDSLFNLNLHYAGIRFYHQPAAIVRWDGRSDLPGYLRMMYHYGFGSAEAGQAFHRYRDWALTTLVPPLILLSPHPLKDAGFRYRRNAAAAWGWIKGKLTGHKPPPGWKHVAGGWMSPETLAHASKSRQTVPDLVR